MKTWKKAFIFALAMLPVSLVAIWFTVRYQLSMYDDATVALLLSQAGSMELVYALTMVQNCSMIFAACVLGYILASKLSLLKPLRVQKQPLLITLALSAIGGAVLSLDYWTFGAAEPMIREATAAGMTFDGILASILYGGIVEELLMRLFFLSLVAWLLWKLLWRKQEHAPEKAIILANVIAALLFAAGHLPSTVMTFGGITPLLLARCFLLNGGFGLVFGWLYRKHGLQYAILAHAMAHIVSKLIWALFL